MVPVLKLKFNSWQTFVCRGPNGVAACLWSNFHYQMEFHICYKAREESKQSSSLKICAGLHLPFSCGLMKLWVSNHFYSMYIITSYLTPGVYGAKLHKLY